jgi:hypothetical protein
MWMHYSILRRRKSANVQQTKMMPLTLASGEMELVGKVATLYLYVLQRFIVFPFLHGIQGNSRDLLHA